MCEDPAIKISNLECRGKESLRRHPALLVDLLKPTLNLDETFISWCFTRDGRHCLVLKQSTASDSESEFQTIFQ